jgi:hypothetical protein
MLGPAGQQAFQAELPQLNAERPLETRITSFTVAEATQLSAEITRKRQREEKLSAQEVQVADEVDSILKADAEQAADAGAAGGGGCIDESVCDKCKSAKSQHRSPFIGCDSCARWFHTGCLSDPALAGVIHVDQVEQVGDWVCPFCIEEQKQH